MVLDAAFALLPFPLCTALHGKVCRLHNYLPRPHNDILYLGTFGPLPRQLACLRAPVLAKEAAGGTQFPLELEPRLCDDVGKLTARPHRRTQP